MTTIDRSPSDVVPSDPTPAAFRIERHGPIVVVAGEIDAFAAEPLRRALTGRVDVIDLSAVTFFSAAGVGVLVECGKGCPTDPVVHTSPAVDRVMGLCAPGDAGGITLPGD